MGDFSIFKDKVRYFKNQVQNINLYYLQLYRNFKNILKMVENAFTLLYTTIMYLKSALSNGI